MLDDVIIASAERVNCVSMIANVLITDRSSSYYNSSQDCVLFEALITHCLNEYQERTVIQAIKLSMNIQNKKLDPLQLHLMPVHLLG
jgi:hypothetical protein